MNFLLRLLERLLSRSWKKKETRCSFLANQGVHRVKLWTCECMCVESAWSLDSSRLESSKYVVPVSRTFISISKAIKTWEDYYNWSCIPLHSPVAILLHLPLTVYWAIQLTLARSVHLEKINELNIHYLGPEMELSKLAVFAELHALFPGVRIHLELVGPTIPDYRDGERIDLYQYVQCNETDCNCKSSDKDSSSHASTFGVTLRLHAGYYHDCYRDLTKESLPHLIIGQNAGIAAYTSWSPTIELIKEVNVPTIFTDFCEEASNLAASCISSIAGRPLAVPIQLNPFRQPLVVEDSALLLPCYSNCFLFGI